MLYGAQPALLWLTIEAELAIVCASVPALRKFFLQASGVMSTRKATANTAGEKSQPPGTLHGPERKASAQTLGRQEESVDTEHSAGSEDEIVQYDLPRRVGPARRGTTFYDEETIDVP
jgi:hypothetical protein